MSGKFLTGLCSMALLTITSSAMAASTVISTYSVSPSDFLCGNPLNTSYTIYGNYFFVTVGTTFIAPIHLPNGATITGITFYWNDQSDQNADLTLYIDDFTSNPIELDTVFSTGKLDLDTSSNITTSWVVDNDQYAYYLQLYIPNNVRVYGVQIVYEVQFYTSFLSLIKK
jgi:hypothetical protein